MNKEKMCKEKRKESRRKYREKNKEKIDEDQKRWVEKNKEKVKEITRRYIEKNSEKIKKKQRERFRKTHPLIIKRCEICNNEYKTSIYKSSYCNKCKIYKKTKEYKERNVKEKECEQCGKKFISIGRTKGHTIKRFCSRKCCMKIAIKRNYKRNLEEKGEKYKQELRDRTKKNHHKIRKYIHNFKKDKKCCNCGWNEFPVILQFHHRDNEKKIGTISMMNSFKKVKEEIMKCDLLCPNCHYWLHSKKKYM